MQLKNIRIFFSIEMHKIKMPNSHLSSTITLIVLVSCKLTSRQTTRNCTETFTVYSQGRAL